MSDCPLWKRVGLHNTKTRTEGSRSPYGHLSSREPSSSQGTKRMVAQNKDVNADSQHGSNKEKSMTPYRMDESDLKEEEIFQSCLNKFKEVSQIEGRTSGIHCEKQVVKSGLGPIHQIEVSETNPASTHSKAQSRNVIERMKQLSEVLNNFKEIMADSKQQIETERCNYFEYIRSMAKKLADAIAIVSKPRKLKESYTQTERTSSFRNSKHQEETQFSQEGHEDLLFVRTTDSLKRKDISHSVTKSQNEQQRDKTFIENLELRQKINMLSTNVQMLQSEMEHLKLESEQERNEKQKARMEDIQNIYASNKALMKQTIEKYMQELFSKDHIISNLKAQLNQKNQQVLKLQARKSQIASPVSEVSLGNLYTRRYKELYEKVEAERLKLRTELDSALRQKEDILGNLDALRQQSGNVVHENIELIQKLQEYGLETTQKLSQMRCNLTRDFKIRQNQLAKEVYALKSELELKDRKIELLDRLILRSKQKNASIRVQDRQDNRSEMSDEVEENFNQPRRPPAVAFESIRSLPGNNSPANQQAKTSRLRQTLQDVTKFGEKPKLERKQSQPYGRGSTGFIAHTIRKELQIQSREQSKNSAYECKVSTERGARQKLFNLVQSPRTPNMGRLQNRTGNSPSVDYERKSLSEQVETLSNMMKNQLQSSSRRRGV